MQVNVIRGGETAFNSLVYPPPDTRLLQYFANNIQAAYDTLGEVGQQFIGNVKSMYDKFNSEAALNTSKLLMYQAGMHFNQDVIYPVPMDQLGLANNAMQAFIIAQPDVNRLYQKDMCYGYQDTYINPEPDNSGEERLHYKLAMHGMLQFDDTEEGSGFVKYYSTSDDVERLSTLDKFSVIDTWHNVLQMIASGNDPTDPDHGTL